MSVLRGLVSEKGRAALFWVRRFSPAARALPDFIVIGAQKSGTSSMFSYLRQHPQVLRPMYKEIYYFDRYYGRGISWYRRNFPAQAALTRLANRLGRRCVTFEATATYIFDANAPRRISQDLDTRRFVALLRDPVDRAISNYWHARRLGRESRGLMEAMEADLARFMADQAFEAGVGPRPSGFPVGPAYLRRGIYHEAISRWLEYFSRENMLLLKSEAMFADPASTMERVFAFLDLSPTADIDYAPLNVGEYDGCDAEVRNLLSSFYAPHNEVLSRLCGSVFEW